MNWGDWYTDLLDIWRVVEVKDGNLTRHERVRAAAQSPAASTRATTSPST